MCGEERGGNREAAAERCWRLAPVSHMRILFHKWEYPPRGAGIGRYVAAMARALDERGHSVVVFTSRGDGELEEERLGVHGRIVRGYRFCDVGRESVTRQLLSCAERQAVDVIEAGDHLGETAGVLASPDRPPVIVKCHYNDALHAARYAQAYYPWQMLAIDAACWKDRARIQRERISIERADALLACSQYMLDALQRERFALPGRRTVLSNPVEALPRWVNAEADVPTLLLVGRIDIGKGIQFLPSIVGALATRFAGLRIEVAGPDGKAFGIPSFRAWLEGRLGRQCESVRFLGALDSCALDAAYRRAWVVIVPSRWDTFPTVVLEAMARSKPIVASPNGGMPEMLATTGCRIADPSGPGFAEAVGDFLASSKLRAMAGESARQRVATVYAPAVIAEQYESFIGDVLRGRERRS